MKKVIYFLAPFLIWACSPQQKKPMRILNSEKADIKISLRGQSGDWHISPELRPDVFKVECLRDSNTVTFVSDKDSVVFNVALHDTINFVVLLNGKDSAYTQIIGTEKNVNFTKAYIQSMQGKFGVEVPEVHELANVLVALSKVGRADSNMVDMTTPYYKKMMAYFMPYDKHAAIQEINKHLTKVMDDQTYRYYYALKMNACGYDFNEQGDIINRGFVKHMGFGSPDDPFKTQSKLFADFARVSNFRAFYQSNKYYYDSLVALYKKYNPIDKMQTWLAKKFGFDYGSYYVYFSPLIGGAHATTRFSDNNFEQTFMFVCSASKFEKYNEAVTEMLNSRVVFTEIDHNFVNPVSDKNVAKIDKAFSKRNVWVHEGNGTSMYGSNYAVFNEYMTFAVFSLYCLDQFKADDAETGIALMEKLMSSGRGFKNFKAFNRKLMALYQTHHNMTMDEMYAAMLDWSKAQ